MLKLVLDMLMRTAEEIPDWRPKEHFLGEKRFQVRCLFEPLMPRNPCAAFGTEKEGHFLLR